MHNTTYAPPQRSFFEELIQLTHLFYIRENNFVLALRRKSSWKTLPTIKNPYLTKYRDKNFFQFVFSQKVQPIMVMVLICFGGGIFSVLFFTKNSELLYSLLLTFMFLVLFYTLSHIGDFMRYFKGKKLCENMRKSGSILSENIKTYIPNYNAFGVGTFGVKIWVNKNGNFKFTEYFFDKSDLLLTDGSAYLFGYGNRFLITGYAVPIEIENVGFKRYFNSAKIESYNVTSSKIYLQIKDPSYKEPIKLEFEYRKEIEEWLTAPPPLVKFSKPQYE